MKRRPSSSSRGGGSYKRFISQMAQATRMAEKVAAQGVNMAKLRILFAALILDFSCTAAQAQMFNNFAGQMLMSRQALAPVRGLQLRNSLGGAPAAASAVGRRLQGRAPPLVEARTDYRRDPAVSAQARAEFARSMGQRFGPQVGAAVADDLRRTDFVQLWTRAVGADGFRDNDIADALAAYIGLNWNIANRGDLNTAQLATLRHAVHAAMASDPEIARMSSAQRQVFAENLMFVFDYLAKGYNDAEHTRDRGKLSELSNLAQSRMQDEMSLNMRAMRIGANGQISTG